LANASSLYDLLLKDCENPADATKALSANSSFSADAQAPFQGVNLRSCLCMAVLGQATLALVPPNPFTSKLARDCEKPIAHFATQMALLCSEISGKKHQFALGRQVRRSCEKASASPLASVFCKTAPAFAQRINAVIFLSSYLTRSLPLI
jgi:hypothetical protein